MMKSKLRRIKNLWRAFSYAYKLTGAQYDYESGILTLSSQQQQQLRNKFRDEATAVLYKGLIVGEGLNVEEWQEIFSDHQPASKNEASATQEAIDDVFASHSLIDDDLAPSVAADDHNIPDLSDDEVKEVDEVVHVDDEGPPSEQTPATPTPTATGGYSTAPSVSRRSSTPLTANLTLDKVRKRQGSTLEVLLEPEVKRLIRGLVASRGIAGRSQHIMQHQHSQREIGADDLENAIKSCERFAKPRSIRLFVKLAMLMKQDKKNPVIWNSIEDDDLKEAWAADILSCDLGDF
jgi:hypothetical protein